MSKRKFALAGVAAVAAASVLSMTAQTALADPPTTVPPTFRTYNAVGSDTIQDISNQLFNVDYLSWDAGSYDAFKPAGVTADCIQTSSTGPEFRRPQGSGDGADALSSAWHRNSGVPTNKWQTCDASGHLDTSAALVELDPQDVAFSRSSSRPSVAGSDLTYIPFARDAVTVAYNDGSGTLGSLNLSTLELHDIYSGSVSSGDTTVTISSNTPTGTVQINGHTIHPLIPQMGSGTRSFFLGAIGVSALAQYITDPALPGGNHENNGGALSAQGDLIPFSAAQWIAQNTGAATNTTNADLKLAEINSKAAVDGTGESSVPGDLYGTFDEDSQTYTDTPGTGSGVFERDVYYVVPSAANITAYNGLRPVNSESTIVNHLENDLYSTSTATDDIQKYGFGLLFYYGGGFLTGGWTK
jgi:hypothetical protein